MSGMVSKYFYREDYYQCMVPKRYLNTPECKQPAFAMMSDGRNEAEIAQTQQVMQSISSETKVLERFTETTEFSTGIGRSCINDRRDMQTLKKIRDIRKGIQELKERIEREEKKTKEQFDKLYVKLRDTYSLVYGGFKSDDQRTKAANYLEKSAPACRSYFDTDKMKDFFKKKEEGGLQAIGTHLNDKIKNNQGVQFFQQNERKIVGQYKTMLNRIGKALKRNSLDNFLEKGTELFNFDANLADPSAQLYETNSFKTALKEVTGKLQTFKDEVMGDIAGTLGKDGAIKDLSDKLFQQDSQREINQLYHRWDRQTLNTCLATTCPGLHSAMTGGTFSRMNSQGVDSTYIGAIGAMLTNQVEQDSGVEESFLRVKQQNAGHRSSLNYHIKIPRECPLLDNYRRLTPDLFYSAVVKSCKNWEQTASIPGGQGKYYQGRQELKNAVKEVKLKRRKLAKEFEEELDRKLNRCESREKGSDPAQQIGSCSVASMTIAKDKQFCLQTARGCSADLNKCEQQLDKTEKKQRKKLAKLEKAVQDILQNWHQDFHNNIIGLKEAIEAQIALHKTQLSPPPCHGSDLGDPEIRNYNTILSELNYEESAPQVSFSREALEWDMNELELPGNINPKNPKMFSEDITKRLGILEKGLAAHEKEVRERTDVRKECIGIRIKALSDKLNKNMEGCNQYAAALASRSQELNKNKNEHATLDDLCMELVSDYDSDPLLTCENFDEDGSLTQLLRVTDQANKTTFEVRNKINQLRASCSNITKSKRGWFNCDNGKSTDKIDDVLNRVSSRLCGKNSSNDACSNQARLNGACAAIEREIKDREDRDNAEGTISEIENKLKKEAIEELINDYIKNEKHFKKDQLKKLIADKNGSDDFNCKGTKGSFNSNRNISLKNTKSQTIIESADTFIESTILGR